MLAGINGILGVSYAPPIDPALLLSLVRDSSNIYSDISSYLRIVENNNIQVNLPNTDNRFNPAGYFTGGGLTYTNSNPISYDAQTNLVDINSTLQAWIYPTLLSNGGIYTIISKDNHNINLAYSFGINVDGSGNKYLRLTTNNAVDSLSFPISIQINQWSHVAVTVSSSHIATFYVNGISVGSGNITLTNASAPLYVGRSSYGGASFRFLGLLSHVEVARTLRYSGNFTPGIYDPDGNTALFVRMNQADEFSDLAGLGTVSNENTTIEFLPIVRLPFNGVNSYLSVSDLVGLTNLVNFTIETTITCSAQIHPYPNIIATQAGWSVDCFALRFSNTEYINKFSAHWNPGDPIINSGADYAVDISRIVALTYDGVNLKLYVDSALTSTVAVSGRILNFNKDAQALRVGGGQWDGDDGYFKGVIDTLKIWNYAKDY